MTIKNSRIQQKKKKRRENNQPAVDQYAAVQTVAED